MLHYFQLLWVLVDYISSVFRRGFQ